MHLVSKTSSGRTPCSRGFARADWALALLFALFASFVAVREAAATPGGERPILACLRLCSLQLRPIPAIPPQCRTCLYELAEVLQHLPGHAGPGR
jgi:hypothetical protein